MATIDQLAVDDVLGDPARKQQFVTPMFDVIAPRYDDFTRLFSFGMDRRWKGDLLAAVQRRASTADRCLDVACGTGDLAAALVQALPTRVVVGLDASSGMVRAARARHGDGGPHFVVGDVMALPLPPASVTLVTAGYAIRNAPTVDGALAELARVVPSGGWVAVLDFYKPSAAWWRLLFLTYLRLAGDLVGWRWHGRAVIYGYIARSIAGFVTAAEFTSALDRAGFTVHEERRYLLGGIALHLAQRR